MSNFYSLVSSHKYAGDIAAQLILFHFLLVNRENDPLISHAGRLLMITMFKLDYLHPTTMIIISKSLESCYDYSEYVIFVHTYILI